MKKSIFIFFLSIIIMFISVCTVEPEYTTGGMYLQITASGKYFNEVFGTESDEDATLEAIINLYPEDSYDQTSRFSAGGVFQRSSAGVITGVRRGSIISSAAKFGGSAHLNGFIAKGPMNEGTPVTISILDENFEKIEIDPEIKEYFENTLSKGSEFALELPTTEDVTVNMNANILSTMQYKRMDTLVKSGQSFVQAKDKSKEEVLSVFNLGSEAGSVGDFSQMSLTGDNHESSLLLTASAIMADNPDLIDDIMTDLSENGTITKENISDAVTESVMNLDLATITDNLSNYYEDIGETGVVIPDGSDYQDSDGDGNIDLYETVLISPLGFVDPVALSFDWSDINITGIEYAIQVATSNTFTDGMLIDKTVPASNYSPTETFQNDITYYWRIAPIVSGTQKNWTASASFIPTTSATMPTGTIYIKEGSDVVSRVITIGLESINGATDMRFALSNDFTNIEFKPFELSKKMILPKGSTNVTVYAELKNSIDTLSTSVSVNYDNTVNPAGTFTVNGDASTTLTPEVILDLSGITGAYKMRFSNDNTFDTTAEQWVNFEVSYNWTLSAGAGEKTVYAEFKNINSTHKTTDTITLVEAYTVSYDANGAESGTVPIDNNGYIENETVYLMHNSGNLTRSGHTFRGWNTKADGSGTFYNEGDPYIMPANNVTFYAEWQVGLSVTYHANGATTGSVPLDNNMYNIGDTITVLGNSGNLEYTGYIFNGWNTNSYGTGTNHTEGDTVTLSSDLHLYAEWLPEPSTYNVTYQGNGHDSGGPPVDTYSYYEGETYIVWGFNDIKKSGYYFNGWNTASDGSGTLYHQDDTFTMPANDVTLYADWIPVPKYIYVDGSLIMGANMLDGSDAQTLYDTGVSPNALAWNPMFNEIYYCEYDGNIHRYTLTDGGSLLDTTISVTSCEDLEFDPIENKIYWITFNTGIYRQFADGSGSMETIVSDAIDGLGSNVRELALDNTNNYVYWADLSTANYLYRRPKDGSGSKETIDVTTTSSPHSIQLDTSLNLIYWSSYGDKNIKKATIGLPPTGITEIWSTTDGSGVVEIYLDTNTDQIIVRIENGTNHVVINTDGSGETPIGLSFPLVITTN